MFKWSVAGVLAVGGWMGAPGAGAGAGVAWGQNGFEITPVTDSVNGPVNVFAHVSINDHGTVALFGSIPSQVSRGVFSIGDGQVKTITSNLGSGLFSTSINNHGVVAYSGRAPNGDSIIGIGDGDSPAQVLIDENSPLLTCESLFACLYGASINDHGAVAFVGNDQGNRSLFTFDNGVFTTTEDLVGPMLDIGDATDINNDGVVAFGAVPTTPGLVSLFTLSNGQLDEVAKNFGSPFHGFGLFGGNPSINASGQVASNASFDDGTSGVVIFEGGPDSDFIQIADDSGEASFAILRAASINDQGRVAFQADLDNGGRGIFIADENGVQKVIASGDPLFGSTVGFRSFDLDMTNHALNNRDQLAFQYILVDGTRGVAIAQVPEPATLGVLLTGLVALGHATRRPAMPRR